MTLKELRVSKKLTQKDASDLVKMPLRTYQDYENDMTKENSIKYNYLLTKITEYGFIDEEHGILSLNTIVKTCDEIFRNYNVEYCYLFGSYAKNKPNEKSDIDLLISSTISGLDFYGLVENLRQSLKKRIDLITINQVEENVDLLNNILKDGIKIYG